MRELLLWQSCSYLVSPSHVLSHIPSDVYSLVPSDMQNSPQFPVHVEVTKPYGELAMKL